MQKKTRTVEEEKRTDYNRTELLYKGKVQITMAQRKEKKRKAQRRSKGNNNVMAGLLFHDVHDGGRISAKYSTV